MHTKVAVSSVIDGGRKLVEVEVGLLVVLCMAQFPDSIHHLTFNLFFLQSVHILTPVFMVMQLRHSAIVYLRDMLFVNFVLIMNILVYS